MKINSYEELQRWTFVWPSTEDGPWPLNGEGIGKALGNNRTAIGVYWIGYSQCGTHASFQPNTAGRR